jgi:DNA-binding Lrp family transcriptional regulator
MLCQNAQVRHFATNRRSAGHAPVDSLDLRLISSLRENARLSIAQLAVQLKVSRATVQNRIDKLIDNRVLLGFTVRTTPEVSAHRVRAMMMIAVDGDRSDAILGQLRGYPEVRALHTTNGRWDIVAELGTDSLETFDAALRSIRTIKGIANSETSLLLSTHKV